MRALLKFATVIDGIGRLARGVEWAASLNPHGAAHKPLSDPRGVRNAVQADLGSSSKVEYGYVVDAIPGLSEYRVMPEGGGPLLECTSLMHGASGPVGVYDGSSLGAGCHVRYIRHRQKPLSGVIIGSEPCFHYDPTLMYSDIVSQGSNTGIHLESGFKGLLKLGGAIGEILLNGGLVNYGGRTPWDSTAVGELNYSTETGLMLHMDPYMAFLRADELTGLWVFYWDGLLRIAGQQLQEITSISTREVYDDEGEGSVYHGVAPYPWEARGMLGGPNDNLTVEHDDPKITQKDKPYYSRIEPKDNDQQAFHRFQRYGGYLGQHEKTVISAPHQGSVSSGDSESFEPNFRYRDKYQAAGLYDQQITMAGHMFMRSALGITIAKRPIIPVPKRMKIVTDDGGDKHGNYKASDYYTDGAAGLRDHKVQPTPTIPGTGAGEDGVYAATAVLDLHAHMFNWEGLHPFYYHQNDYFVPEESAYDFVSTNQEIPNWAQLNSLSQWYLTPASTVKARIDHRKGDSASVYKNTSYLTLLDDGGVLIGGGCGEEIRMVGGDIFLSCPGDVFMEAGRNVIAWGGRDCCIRAWNSVDITANTGDVRAKAECNMQLLSANGGGPHGTFIECRAEGPPQYDFTMPGEGVEHAGIILQALGTEICQYADSIYLRTCVADDNAKYPGTSGAAAVRKQGDITLDCYGCCGDITTRSRNVKHWVCCEVMHSFDPTYCADQSKGVNLFTKDGTVLCGDLYADGAIMAYKDILTKANVVAGDTLYASSCDVMQLQNNAAATAANRGHVNEISLRAWADAQWVIDFDEMWYAAGRPGNDDTIASMWVTLRSSADYKADAFTLYESRWAQMARSSGGTPSTMMWTENAVETNIYGQDTHPFPGTMRLTVAGDTYKQHSFLLYKPEKQQAVDRATDDESSVYESTVTLNTPSYKKLDGNYPIIGK